MLVVRESVHPHIAESAPNRGSIQERRESERAEPIPRNDPSFESNLSDNSVELSPVCLF